MSAVQPGCYHRCGHRAAVGRHFCSARCAAEWAESMAEGNDDEWCVPCQAWNPKGHDDKLLCGHVSAKLTVGAKHAEASAQYNRAIRHSSGNSKADSRRFNESLSEMSKRD